MRSRLLFGVLVLLLIGSGAPTRAQPLPDAGVERLVEEVAGLNRSLERLVVLLEGSLANQQVDLLLKRIDLKERRLAPLSAELREAEKSAVRAASEIRRIEEMRDQQERQISRDVREGNDRPDTDARRMMQKIEATFEYQSSRAEDEQARARRLEDELAEGREEIIILEELLQELLRE
jgi:hypothetical protein